MDEPGHDLGVSTTVEDDATVIAVWGEIDLDTAPRLRDAVDDAIGNGSTRLVFDLSRVEFMDSSGISVILETRSSGTDIVLRNPPHSVLRLIEATGLTDVLQVEP
jgi:anti-sigma B factor antagonist